MTYTSYVTPSDNIFILNRCSDDGDISSTDFTSTSTVGLKTRYYAQFYVFKFYDSSNVFFKCSVLVCPSDGSANCAVSSVSCYILQLSLVTRNTDFCICENKDSDQLRSNCAADQRLCFHYMDSTIPLLSKSEISSL